MIFYAQVLSEQKVIAKRNNPSNDTENEKMLDISIQQRDILDVKRRILGKIMINYNQFNLIDPDTNSVALSSFIKNKHIKDIVESELKYVKEDIKYEVFVKDLAKSLDQMTFFIRVTLRLSIGKLW